MRYGRIDGSTTQVYTAAVAEETQDQPGNAVLCLPVPPDFQAGAPGEQIEVDTEVGEISCLFRVVDRRMLKGLRKTPLKTWVNPVCFPRALKAGFWQDELEAALVSRGEAELNQSFIEDLPEQADKRARTAAEVLAGVGDSEEEDVAVAAVTMLDKTAFVQSGPSAISQSGPPAVSLDQEAPVEYAPLQSRTMEYAPMMFAAPWPGQESVIPVRASSGEES